MKKLILVLFLIGICSSIAIAETNVETTWDGSGYFDQTIDSEEQETWFETSGAGINGKFTYTNSDDNPYNYGVDTTNTYVESTVNNGYSMFNIDRTKSHSSYGNAGQSFYGEVYSDGSAEMFTGAKTNYANMISSTYGKAKTSSGKNFELYGSDFGAFHRINDGEGNGASFTVVGSGSSLIDSMSSEMKGTSWKFGKGAGCYLNADMDNTGTGIVDVNAWSNDGIDIDRDGMHISGDGTSGSATYNLNIGYSGNFQFDNFAMSGN